MLPLQLRRLLAVFGLVERGEFRFQIGMAGEALRIGRLVVLAPIALFLEFGRQLRVALAADVLGHAMLGAPPRAMIVRGMVMIGMVVVAVIVTVMLVAFVVVAGMVIIGLDGGA